VHAPPNIPRIGNRLTDGPRTPHGRDRCGGRLTRREPSHVEGLNTLPTSATAQHERPLKTRQRNGSFGLRYELRSEHWIMRYVSPPPFLAGSPCA
jgi:hypothetical protein